MTIEIYLDQNKWIDLARSKKDRDKYSSIHNIYLLLHEAVINSDVIVPLSSAHVIELYKVHDPDHRKRIADVMVDLSQGWTIAPSNALAPKEIELQLGKVFGFDVQSSICHLGRGVPFAFGVAEEFSGLLNLTDYQARLVNNALDTPEGLRKQLMSWDETTRFQGITKFQQASLEFSGRVEISRSIGSLYSKTLRKRGYVANLTLALQDTITTILVNNGYTFKDFLDLGKTELMAFFSSVPTLDVEIEITTERNNFWNRRAQPNDMIDIGFLSESVPYTDIVVTEKFWADILHRKYLDQKYNTLIFSDLNKLSDVLIKPS